MYEILDIYDENRNKTGKTIERKDVNGFRDIYVINKDIQLEDISFNDGEVVNCKYVTIKELRAMIKNGEVFEWFSSFLNDYYKVNGKLSFWKYDY